MSKTTTQKWIFNGLEYNFGRREEHNILNVGCLIKEWNDLKIKWTTGNPVETDKHTVDELKKMGYIGYYHCLQE